MAKKKRSPEEMHRQIQDSLQVLPVYIKQQREQGHRAKAMLLQYVSAPMLRLMNRLLSARRYRGTEGEKLRQTEQMRRRLEQKQAAIRQFQASTQQQKRKKKAK